MTNPNPPSVLSIDPAPVAFPLGLGCDVVMTGPEPRTDTRVRTVIESGALAVTLLLDVEAAEQLIDQLPAALSGAVAAAKRHRSGLALPPEKPNGLVRG